MRIIYILKHDSLAGGIRVVATYADKLKRRGHTVTVLSTPEKPPSLKQKVKDLMSGKARFLPKKKPSYFDGLNVEHIVIDKCRPIVNEDVPDADAVIATWWETAEWVNALKPSKGKKFYFIQGHEVFEWLPVDRVKATYLMPLKKITISQWLMDVLRNDYEQTDVTLVPNSVDTDFFNSEPRSRQKIPTVGFVYSTDNFKGCDITINALNMVLKKMHGMRILSFGSHRESTGFPLPRNTEFYYQPAQEKIPGIYASCDFWLFGSRDEGFGLPILEAMACGTPVIANAAGAAPELTSQGGGLLLKEKTPDAMATAIIDCFNAPLEKWEKMSCSARKTAESYTWDHAVIMLENELLAGQK
jgi:glycosyltransferase involved in cell wall biosynthesis